MRTLASGRLHILVLNTGALFSSRTISPKWESPQLILCFLKFDLVWSYSPGEPCFCHVTSNGKSSLQNVHRGPDGLKQLPYPWGHSGWYLWPGHTEKSRLWEIREIISVLKKKKEISDEVFMVLRKVPSFPPSCLVTLNSVYPDWVFYSGKCCFLLIKNALALEKLHSLSHHMLKLIPAGLKQ